MMVNGQNTTFKYSKYYLPLAIWLEKGEGAAKDSTDLLDVDISCYSILISISISISIVDISFN